MSFYAYRFVFRFTSTTYHYFTNMKWGQWLLIIYLTQLLFEIRVPFKWQCKITQKHWYSKSLSVISDAWLSVATTMCLTSICNHTLTNLYTVGIQEKRPNRNASLICLTSLSYLFVNGLRLESVWWLLNGLSLNHKCPIFSISNGYEAIFPKWFC